MQKKIQLEYWIPIFIFLLILFTSLLLLFLPSKKQKNITQKHQNIYFQNITLKYITQGKTKWTALSKTLTLDKNKNYAELKQSTIFANHPITEKRLIQIKAPFTTYNLQNQLLKSNDSTTDLFYLDSPTKIKAKNLTWNLDKNTLKSQKSISIFYRNFHLSGKTFYMDLNTNNFILKDNFKIKTIHLTNKFKPLSLNHTFLKQNQI